MHQSPQAPAVIVGVDGSAPSILALRWAGSLAPLFQTPIKAVTAWQFQIAAGTFTPVVWNPEEEARIRCAEAVARAFGGASPEGLEMMLRLGPAAKILIEESQHARLLNVGSRGHGGFEGLLLGAVSAAVAAHARCSVLIAHGTELPPELSLAFGPSRSRTKANDGGPGAEA
ncbi:Universal stress protein MSMEG_3950/MSMEI_3859 [Arthrobacter sp. Bi83]|jgi:nucleotide-binding universal stress UspA family protein|uniref:universal stress protein n=1 Tax=Arthrobacter sp. Bi83 TaxID=2822353 RepID=UPI001D3FB31F|nr:universal stress protein [Arthrobacter sp. Bi83]CAH0131033.1 Universal stress protein MSMEG_3950/MSMEI_3859 [Arthrobacter sp. Bi83]